MGPISLFPDIQELRSLSPEFPDFQNAGFIQLFVQT
jgi:hypothetical protein